MNVSWNILVGPVKIGDLCSLQMSLGIALNTHDWCYSVWTRQWERFYADNIAEHDRYGDGSVMVWGGISWDGCTEPWALDQGTLTAQRYGDDIPDVHVKCVRWCSR